VGQSLHSPNRFLRVPDPTSLQEGSLCRCIIDLGKEFVQSTNNEHIEPEEFPTDIINDMSGMLDIEEMTPGSSYSYGTIYESSDCRWYPIGNFNTTELRDVPFANNFKSQKCPTTTGDIEANYATLVNHNFLDETKPLLIKIAPYHCESGAINIVAKIRVTYSSTIEFRTAVDLGFFTMNLNGLEHNMLADDIWEMAGVPEYMWNVNRPRTLTMHKVGLTYNHSKQNINISRTVDNRNENVSSDDTTSNDDVRSRVSTVLQRTYDANFDLQASGIPARFTPPHSSTPIPNRYKMKKGNRSKPYPYRADIKM
jgi:hypothetical protein